MSHPVLTLELPEDIYERVRRAAKGMNQPVETVLVNIVRAATPSLEKVPTEYRAELERLEDLGDDELGRIARSRPAPDKQRRLERLLDKGTGTGTQLVLTVRTPAGVGRLFGPPAGFATQPVGSGRAGRRRLPRKVLKQGRNEFLAGVAMRSSLAPTFP